MRFFRRVFAALARQCNSPKWRASVLLRQNLTDTQLSQYTTFGYFEVRGGATGNRYRIHDIHQMNIDEADSNGVWVHTWCFSPVGTLARSDILLAQKIALELFEPDARRVGTKYPARRRTSAFDVG